MKKMVEITYCDRCKKENKTKEIYWRYFRYDLCEKCEKDFNKMKNELDILQKKFDDITKKYEFGEYLPKDKEVE